jgi:hypothetical protein
MALISIVRPAAVAGVVSKQISVSALSGGVAFYTVPPGKTFVGFAISIAGQMGLIVNGTTQQMSWPSAWNIPVPLTLIAGSVVTSQSSYMQWNLIGVES